VVQPFVLKVVMNRQRAIITGTSYFQVKQPSHILDKYQHVNFNTKSWALPFSCTFGHQTFCSAWKGRLLCLAATNRPRWYADLLHTEWTCSCLLGSVFFLLVFVFLVYSTLVRQGGSVLSVLITVDSISTISPPSPWQQKSSASSTRSSRVCL
jgi:hypothetical protein